MTGRRTNQPIQNRAVGLIGNIHFQLFWGPGFEYGAEIDNLTPGARLHP